MDIMNSIFWLTLVNIIFIDLILAGDNAIVIGMAARKLPPQIQKKAILYGTAGAILLRILATIVVVWLLNIPWLQVAGGILLIYIAYKVLIDEEHDESIQAKDKLWPAVRTIVIADAAMGLDNVIAVAGAANHHIGLVIIGLLISIPIVVWGSTLIIKLLAVAPWIAYIGAGVLAYTAAHMITKEPNLQFVFGDKPLLTYLFIFLVIAGVVLTGYWVKRSRGHDSHPATP